MCNLGVQLPSTGYDERTTNRRFERKTSQSTVDRRHSYIPPTAPQLLSYEQEQLVLPNIVDGPTRRRGELDSRSNRSNTAALTQYNNIAKRSGGARTVLLDGLMSSNPVMELIPGRFYFTVIDGLPVIDTKSRRRPVLFSIDNELIYKRFFRDFGPLNLAQITTYLRKVKSLLDNAARDGRHVVHYCSSHPEKRPNAILLASAYLLLYCNLSPAEAIQRVNGAYPPVVPFRDATTGICPYPCTIFDCLCGLQYAHTLGWYDPRRFNIEEYNYYDSLLNGDVNWVIPGKILAFSSPQNERLDMRGYPAHVPEDYHIMFRSMKVKLIVRLNNKLYDRSRFTIAGFAHMDLYFPDGSCPSSSIIGHFTQAIESVLDCPINPGTVAVHCKAGLGRTGCIIGAYAIRRYRFPAQAWIGWNRVCRPGSILGQQQQFLCEYERSIWAPQMSAALVFGSRFSASPGYGGEDVGQGDRLIAAKRESERERLLARRSHISAALSGF